MKIDCNMTENYLRYKGKMCNLFNGNWCFRCPLSKENNGTGELCEDYQEDFPEEAIEIMQKWVDENIPDDGEKNDPVNQPSHYTAGGVECIEAIKASMTDEEFQGFLKGQVIKYVWRYLLKDNPLQDLEKAKFYLDRLIECIKGGSLEEDQEEDETPRAMWIENILGLICTCGHCGASRLGISDYCPNCGAKMAR